MRVVSSNSNSCQHGAPHRTGTGRQSIPGREALPNILDDASCAASGTPSAVRARAIARHSPACVRRRKPASPHARVGPHCGAKGWKTCAGSTVRAQIPAGRRQFTFPERRECSDLRKRRSYNPKKQAGASQRPSAKIAPGISQSARGMWRLCRPHHHAGMHIEEFRITSTYTEYVFRHGALSGGKGRGT